MYLIIFGVLLIDWNDVAKYSYVNTTSTFGNMLGWPRNLGSYQVEKHIHALPLGEMKTKKSIARMKSTTVCAVTVHSPAD